MKDQAKWDAAARGLPTYRGTVCKYGHDSPRYTKSGRCVACQANANAGCATRNNQRMLAARGGLMPIPEGWRIRPEALSAIRDYVDTLNKHYGTETRDGGRLIITVPPLPVIEVERMRDEALGRAGVAP